MHFEYSLTPKKFVFTYQGGPMSKCSWRKKSTNNSHAYSSLDKNDILIIYAVYCSLWKNWNWNCRSFDWLWYNHIYTANQRLKQDSQLWSIWIFKIQQIKIFLKALIFSLVTSFSCWNNQVPLNQPWSVLLHNEWSPY